MSKMSQLHADLEQARSLGFDPQPGPTERDDFDRHADRTIAVCLILGIAVICAAIVSAFL